MLGQNILVPQEQRHEICIFCYLDLPEGKRAVPSTAATPPPPPLPLPSITDEGKRIKPRKSVGFAPDGTVQVVEIPSRRSLQEQVDQDPMCQSSSPVESHCSVTSSPFLWVHGIGWIHDDLPYSKEEILQAGQQMLEGTCFRAPAVPSTVLPSTAAGASEPGHAHGSSSHSSQLDGSLGSTGSVLAPGCAVAQGSLGKVTSPEGESIRQYKDRLHKIAAELAAQKKGQHKSQHVVHSGTMHNYFSAQEARLCSAPMSEDEADVEAEAEGHGEGSGEDSDGGGNSSDGGGSGNSGGASFLAASTATNDYPDQFKGLRLQKCNAGSGYWSVYSVLSTRPRAAKPWYICLDRLKLIRGNKNAKVQQREYFRTRLEAALKVAEIVLARTWETEKKWKGCPREGGANTPKSEIKSRSELRRQRLLWGHGRPRSPTVNLAVRRFEITEERMTGHLWRLMPNKLLWEEFEAAAEEAHLATFVSHFPSCDAERIKCAGKARPDGSNSACRSNIHFPPLNHKWGEEFDTSEGTCHVDHIHPLAATAKEFGKARSQAMVDYVAAGGGDDPFSLPWHTGLNTDERSKLLHLLFSFDAHPSYAGGLAFRCGHAGKKKPEHIPEWCHARFQSDLQLEWQIGQYVANVRAALALKDQE